MLRRIRPWGTKQRQARRMYKILVPWPGYGWNRPSTASTSQLSCLRPVAQTSVSNQTTQTKSPSTRSSCYMMTFTMLLLSNRGICANTGSKKQRFQYLVYPSSLQSIPTPLVANMLNWGYHNIQEPDTLEKIPTLLLSETYYVFNVPKSLPSCTYRLRMLTFLSPTRP